MMKMRKDGCHDECMHACIQFSKHLYDIAHTHIHTYIHTCTHTSIHLSIHPSIHTYIHTHAHRPVVQQRAIREITLSKNCESSNEMSHRFYGYTQPPKDNAARLVILRVAATSCLHIQIQKPLNPYGSTVNRRIQWIGWRGNSQETLAFHWANHGLP